MSDLGFPSNNKFICIIGIFLINTLRCNYVHFPISYYDLIRYNCIMHDDLHRIRFGKFDQQHSGYKNEFRVTSWPIPRHYITVYLVFHFLSPIVHCIFIIYFENSAASHFVHIMHVIFHFTVVHNIPFITDITI